jgi:hypothetical protein
VIRHSGFETRWTAGQVLPAHTENDAVRRFLYRFQNQLLRRRQRTPHKINVLAHNFNVSNSSRFPAPPCTESAEEPLNAGCVNIGNSSNLSFSLFKVVSEGRLQLGVRRGVYERWRRPTRSFSAPATSCRFSRNSSRRFIMSVLRWAIDAE